MNASHRRTATTDKEYTKPDLNGNFFSLKKTVNFDHYIRKIDIE